ncbi:MAG: sigma-54-dependent transcriptional regulator [Caulobacteraceae bacterium]
MQYGLSRPKHHILFVDDDEDVQKAAKLLLERHDMRVTGAANPAQAWSVLAAEFVDLILLDLNFVRGATSGAEGFKCLMEIMAHQPQALVVVVTGHSGVAIAVEAMRAGARDFVMKPWRNDRLVETLKRTLAVGEPRSIAQIPSTADPDSILLGESPAFQRVRDLIRRAAPTDAAVLIHGAAGTGKSLMARALHRQSLRSKGPLVVVDLAALPTNAAGNALFGDEDGVPGALADARGGTLVLEEISVLTLAVQLRLLTVLRTQTDVRVIAITRCGRETLQERGGLSSDLVFQLNTVEVGVPSLSERGDDALLLAEHFLRLFALRHGRAAKPLTDAAAAAISANPWPGDVRALRQAMERCVIFTDGERHETGDIPFPDGDTPGPAALNLVQSERALVSAALKSNSFNVSHAAKQLGLTRAALYRRMAKHGL